MSTCPRGKRLERPDQDEIPRPVDLLQEKVVGLYDVC